MSTRKQSQIRRDMIRPILACSALSALPLTANAAIYDVTQSFWGNTGLGGSMAWAVDQANTNAGTDTIRVQSGLNIDVDGAPTVSGYPTWLAEFTESVNVEGNNATLVNNPTIVTSGGATLTKINTPGNPYTNPVNPGDIVATESKAFALVGQSGADNSGISVSISNLNLDGLAGAVRAYDNATTTVTGGSFANMVNYTAANATIYAFEAKPGVTLNIDGIDLTRNHPQQSFIDSGTGDSEFFGFGVIAGQNAQLNLENSSITDSVAAGAIDWLGGTANVVSSVIQGSGGLAISNAGGTMNVVNSILALTTTNIGEDISQTQRLVANNNAMVNLIASTVFYDALYTDLGGCDLVAYQCNGMPLTAANGGTLSVQGSAIQPINWDLLLSGRVPYAELDGGNLTADQYSWIFANQAQDSAAVRALFDNPILLTDGAAFDINTLGGGVQSFNSLPDGAYPLLGGVLPGVIPDAGSGGVNELINPIDGQPLLVDVYGNPRVSPDGTRTIGAVQVPAPAVFPLGLLALIGFRFWSRRT